MSDKLWNALVALETKLQAVTQFGSAQIGLLEDSFHKDKFQGKTPAAFIEWRGDEESAEGSDDDTETRLNPVPIIVVVMWKPKNSSANRREKLQLGIKYSNYVKNAFEADLTLGGNCVYDMTKVGDTRMSDRPQYPYVGVETDIQILVREDKGAR